MSNDKKVPVEIIIPILEAAPFIYNLVNEFMAMVAKTKEDIATWDDKSEAEQRAILDETSRKFDASIGRFEAALAEVKAK